MLQAAVQKSGDQRRQKRKNKGMFFVAAFEKTIFGERQRLLSKCEKLIRGSEQLKMLSQRLIIYPLPSLAQEHNYYLPLL